MPLAPPAMRANHHLRLLTSSPQRRQKPSLPVRHTGNATLHWRSAKPVAPSLTSFSRPGMVTASFRMQKITLFSTLMKSEFR